MNRRDLLKIGASALAAIPLAPFTFKKEEKPETPEMIWGIETPPIKRVLDLSKEELLTMRYEAQLKSYVIWDFAKCEGDTISEKYQELYVQTVSLSLFLWQNSGKGANVIITSPELASVYMISHGFQNGKAPINKSFLNPPGDCDKPHIKYMGTINARWRLYTTNLYKAHEAIFGRTTDNGAVQFGKNNIGYLEARNFADADKKFITRWQGRVRAIVLASPR